MRIRQQPMPSSGARQVFRPGTTTFVHWAYVTTEEVSQRHGMPLEQSESSDSFVGRVQQLCERRSLNGGAVRADEQFSDPVDDVIEIDINSAADAAERLT